MPPLFTASFFSNTLNKACLCPVVEAQDSMLIQAGHIYVAPGDYHLTVEQDANKNTSCGSAKRERIVGLRPAADIMYQSLLHHFADALVAPIFTGMGQDGTKGLQSKIGNHACITQTADSCVVYGMPKAADDAGLSEGHFTPETFYEEISKYSFTWKA